jgi:hypothetical protein
MALERIISEVLVTADAQSYEAYLGACNLRKADNSHTLNEMI